MGEVFKENFNISNIEKLDCIDKLSKVNLECIDFIFADIGNLNKNINILVNAKSANYKAKIFVFDGNKKVDIFRQVIETDIDGYMTNINNKEEFILAINYILKGKKIYDPEATKMVFKNNKVRMDNLTKREHDIIYKVSEGMNNKEIAKSLYISESTVKCHVSNILHKLNLKNRKEVIIYIKKNFAS